MKPYYPPLVCLLTDFGHKDNYVGVIKGVLYSGLPDVRIVDISHEVPPQDVRFGAFQLLTSYQNFPTSTLFLCVVDPGVGSDRKILYAEAGGKKFIGPDNGILSWVLAKEKPELLLAVDIKKVATEKVSKTFHARDVMAPLAIRMLSGDGAATVGHPKTNWQRIPLPLVEKKGTEWIGEILVIDGYGNLITNVPTQEAEGLMEHAKLWIDINNGKPALRGLADSYASVEKGKMLAIGGSSEFVEIAVRDGSAAAVTGLKQGDKVKFQFRT